MENQKYSLTKCIICKNDDIPIGFGYCNCLLCYLCFFKYLQLSNQCPKCFNQLMK